MKLFCTFAVCAILAVTSMTKADDAMADSKACLVKATDDVGCHLKCMYEKIGFLKDGVYDIQPFIKNLDNKPKAKDRKDEIVKMATACTAEKGDNPCDTAYKVTICLKRSKIH